MSYDSDFESVFMVEFVSGKKINVSFYNVEDVKQYCKYAYKSQAIKSIYQEVYCGEEV